MSRGVRDLSVTALERILMKRKTTLQKLAAERGKLQKNLASVEKRIVLLEGRSSTVAPSVRRRKRPKNKKTLVEVVTDVLSRSKAGYSLSEIAEKVVATRYKSGSTNFKNVLYQCLYHSDEFVHDAETGNYRLKRSNGRS
jgi:hypothetical protein